MKKILLTFMGILCALSSVWADTTVLAAPTETKSSYSDTKGILTITDKSTNGGGIQIGSGSFTVGEKTYTPVKLSGSRLFEISFAENVTINSVKVYATTNGTDAATLGINSSNKNKYGDMPLKGETPKEYDFTGETSIYATKQFLAVIVVDYTVNEGGGEQGGEQGGETEEPVDLGTIKTVEGTTTTWDFTAITHEQAATFEGWTDDNKTCVKNDVGTANTYFDKSWCEGIGIGFNQGTGADKVRVYYDGHGVCFNGNAGSILITIPEGANTLEVYSAQRLLTNDKDITLTEMAGGYTADVTAGQKIEIHRSSGSTFVTKVVTKYVEPVLYDITVAECENGTITASAASSKEGRVVTLTNTPADGYKFAGYNVCKTGDESTTVEVTDGKFVMPAYAVTVSGTFEEITEEPTAVDFMINYRTDPYTLTGTYISGTTAGGTHNDGQHGYRTATASFPVPGSVRITIGNCHYNNSNEAKIMNGEELVGSVNVYTASNCDGSTSFNSYVTIDYIGEATTLTFTGGTYTPYIKVKSINEDEIVTKENGAYQVKANSAVNLKACLDAVATDADCKNIFIPNGTYDFGTEENITISASNVTITGESMGGVIIKNTPAVEGLKKGLFYNKGTNNVFENLTLQSYAPWNNGAERAHAFWDEGDKTVCKNVYLKGYQDTYFSNNRNMTAYFFGGMIEGTTDFICGSGKVYFDNVFINCVNSEHKTSGDVIIAPQPFADSKENEPNFGYIFNNCSINCEGSQRDTYYLGRGWGQTTGSEVDEWIYAIFAGCKFADFAGFTTGAMNGSELTILVQDDGVNLIETNNNGVASFVALAPMDFTEEQDITAYLCTAVTAESVTLVKAEKVPAGAAFVVVGMPNARYTISLTASDSYVTNLFKAGAYTVNEGENVYALNTKGQFQKVAAGVTVPVGKAYLKTDVALTKTISIIDEDTTTGINSANSEVVKGVRKAIVDGQLRIVTPNGMFTTTGAQVK